MPAGIKPEFEKDSTMKEPFDFWQDHSRCVGGETVMRCAELAVGTLYLALADWEKSEREVVSAQ